MNETVDAAPTVTAGGTVNAVDNGAAVTPFAGVTLTNDDTTTVTLTFADADGVLSGTGLGTKTVTGGIASYTFTGTAAAIQATLQGLSFNPTDRAANSPAVDTVFTIAATDATHPTPVTGQVTVHTTAHGDAAPTVTAGGTVNAVDNGAAVTPFAGVTLTNDDTTTVTLTFADADGVLSGTGLGTKTVTGGIASYTFTGTAAAIQATLQGLSFNPTDRAANSPAVDTVFTIAATDATHPTPVTGQVTVHTTAHGDAAPTVTAGGTVNAVDNGAAVTPFAGVTLTNDDTTTVTLTFADADGVLSGTGLGTKTVTGGIASYTFTGTAAAIQATLQGLSFNPTDRAANSPAVDTVFTIAATDATHPTPVTGQVTVHTTAHGDAAPTVTAGGTVNAVDNGAAVTPFAGVTLTNDDTTTVTLTFADADGVLSGTGLGTKTVTGGIASYTFTGTAAAIQATLQGLSFNPTDRAANSPAVDTVFTIAATDATHPTPVTGQVTVHTTAHGDAAPTVTAGGTVNAVDNGAAVTPFAGVTLTNDDTTTVTLTFADADGVLSGTGLGTKTVTGGIASYTFTGTAAAIQATLQGLSFNPTDRAANSPAVDTVFTIAATDATHPTPVTGQVTVHTTAHGDAAPTVTAGGTVNAVDNGAAVTPFAGVTLTNDDTTTVTLTFADADGVLSGTGLGTKTVTGGIASYTFTGTAAAIQATLQGLSFNPTDRAANSPAVDTVFTIAATDATHPTPVTGQVTVHTTAHADSAPVIDSLSSSQVSEDAQVATEVGVFAVHDPEDGQGGLVYELKDAQGNAANAGGLFAVDASGHLTVAKALPDGTGNQNFEITLKVSDKNGGAGSLSTYQTFTITVTDVVAGNHAPDQLQLNGGTVVTVNENAAFAGNLTAHDSDNDTAFTWSFDNTVAGNANNLFEIVDDGNGTKQLKLKAGFDYEALPANQKFVMVYMKADDGKAGGVSATQGFKINIAEVNEAPDNVRLNAATAVTIAENTATNTEVGTLTAHDPEGQAVTYALSDSAGGRFKLDATKTKILVVDGTKLDWEALPEGAKYHEIKVVATDEGGMSSEQVIRINLSDVDDTPTTNHAPSGVALSGGRSAAEYAAAGTLIGSLSATDADGDALSYALTDNAGGRFVLSGHNILVADGFRLDFEQARSHAVTVQVSDGHGGVASQTFAIGVTDVAREVTAGTAGHDVFKAGKYNDRLGGGLGNDKLWGGLGNDQLTGGKGRDTFVFDTKFHKSKNKDLIRDYSVKDDTIWLDNALFKANKTLYAAIKKGSETKPLKMASKFFSLDHAKDRDDFFVYDSHKRVLYYDADGSGSKAGIAIASFTSNKALKNFTYKEFFFI